MATRKPPFDKQQMFDELRLVVLCQANHLAVYGSKDAAVALMGFAAEDWPYPYAETEPSRVDITRVAIHGIMDRAYDYAFQVGAPISRDPNELAQDLNEWRLGANMQFTTGNGSPLANPDSCCRIVADLAFARYKMQEGLDFTVRELALLAGMTEAAVRNSLSLDGIKLAPSKEPGASGMLDCDIAYSWLSKRRGFIDTRDPELQATARREAFKAILREKSFAAATDELIRNAGQSVAEIAERAHVPEAFVIGLLSGKPQLDIAAARRVGMALGVDAAHFTGAAIEAALRAEE